MELAVFVQRVGQRLGVTPVSVPLHAEDAEVIGQSYAQLMHELQVHELAFWDEEGSIPDEFAESMIAMVAAAVVDDFTIPEPQRSNLKGMGDFGLPQASPAERRFRALAAAGPAPGQMAHEFF